MRWVASTFTTLTVDEPSTAPLEPTICDVVPGSGEVTLIRPRLGAAGGVVSGPGPPPPPPPLEPPQPAASAVIVSNVRSRLLAIGNLDRLFDHQHAESRQAATLDVAERHERGVRLIVERFGDRKTD